MNFPMINRPKKMGSRGWERVIEGQDCNYYNDKGKNPRDNGTMTPVDISREVYGSVYGK